MPAWTAETLTMPRQACMRAGMNSDATAFGAVPLAVGVGAHEGSTLVVCLNSLRLLFGRNA